MSEKPVLLCRHLIKTFHDGKKDNQLLRDINFNVYQKEHIAIVGASGSGKSTLLHLLGGLDLPTQGQIILQGTDLATCSPSELGLIRNQNLGFIYQFHHLLKEFDVLENVLMPLLIRGISIQEAREKSIRLLVRVGLKDRLNYKISQISGGERQRVAIARALVTEPACVLADEPTGNLDARTADQIYNLLLELNESLGISFVIVTHDQQLASRMKKIFVLNEGILHARKSG